MQIDSIAWEGDEKEASKHIAMARKCLQGLRAKVGTSVTTASTQLRLSDRAYVVAVIGPGISKAVIVAGYSAHPGAEQRSRQVSEVPDFLSGVALGSVLTQSSETMYMRQFLPTADCAAAFGLSLAPALNARLAVEPDGDLKGKWKERGAAFRPAQTQLVIPTLYSGRMRQVVQFLLGFGIEPARSRYDREPPLLVRYPRTPSQEQVLSTHERQVRARGRQVRYDWSFARTHGITRAADGKLWLVEIGVQQGVIAMPLPLNDTTLDERFRQKLVRLGDDAGITALDAFGGWPTGEPFPTGEGLMQAKRAGIVLELAAPSELEAFYAHSPYSPCMGWSFSLSGNEAHATAWRYASDRIQRGVWFSVRLQIGSTTAVEAAPEAAGVRVRISSLTVDTGERRWLNAKTKRMSRLQCTSVLAQSSPAGALAALRALELTPQAAANAAVRFQQEGKLYWPARFQPWIQFPWLNLGYCVSHVMRQQFGPSLPNPPRCETVVHVLHHGEQLKTVSFLSDPRPSTLEDVDDFEECMFEGDWTQTQSSGPATVQPTMFSSDNDPRAEARPSENRRELSSRAVGFTRAVQFDEIGFPPIGVLVRFRTFKRSYTDSTSTGPVMGASVRVPFWDRSAYYMAVGNGYEFRVSTKSWSYTELADPTRYSTWRNFPGFTPYVRDRPIGEHPAGCGVTTRRTIWQESRVPGFCSDNADHGPWAGVCDNAEALAFSITLPDPPPPEVVIRPQRSNLVVSLYNDTQASPISVVVNSNINMTTWAFQQWFETSPNPDTFDTQFISSTCNALGDRQQTQYDPEPDASAWRVQGGPFVPQMSTEQMTFVGVVNA